MEKKINKIIEEYKKYAEENGFSLNPNKEVAQTLVKGLLEKEKEFGKRYCPCRRITGKKEEDDKIVCPCVYHLEEIEKQGRCFCGLFVKNNKI
jgi:ferredoxin-thioredoxin reductase catalytic chain